MGSGMTFAALFIAASTLGQTLSQEQVDEQNAMYRRFWNEEMEWRFDELPTEGSVPEVRVPYSGHIYLDRNGGTINAMRKYDQAFHRGRSVASRFEQWDTSAFGETRYEQRRVGLFRWTTVAVNSTPHWHGHCNGWTAAAIRHAEPKQSVVRNGVTFSPADIKGLLAEIYIYQDNAHLGGDYGEVKPAELHLTLGNWIGRKKHPVGMEADPGKEKWNYPVYGYASSFARRSDGSVEVKTNVRYAQFSNGEFQQSPRIAKTRYFHYNLKLNEAGQIIGGYYYRDSSRIDLLWMPLQPVKGGTDANQRGNPHIDIDEVLAIWKDSVADETVSNWVAFNDSRKVETPAEEPSEVVVASAEEPIEEEATEEQPAAAEPPAAEPTDSESTVDDRATESSVVEATAEEPAAEAPVAEELASETPRDEQ